MASECFFLIAILGWINGDTCRIRLYSTKSFKPLGTLRYHKMACQAVEFTRAWNRSGAVIGEGDDEEDEKEREKQLRWFICGGKDHRVTIWELMEFGRKTQGA